MNTYNNNNKEMSNILTIDEIYKFVDLYFKRQNLLFSHLHNSFNKFLDEDIKIFLEKGDHSFFDKITKDKFIKYKFKYENVVVKPPTLENEVEPLFPSDALNRSLTYSGKILAKVTQIQEITDIQTNDKIEKIIGQPEENVPIANIPIMVGSQYCSRTLYKNQDKSESRFDPGGYFISKGAEKVIISQDRICENKVEVHLKKESGFELYTAQINSKSYKPHGLSQIISIKMKRDGIITIKAPILSEVHIFMVIRALGIESDRDIVNYIVYDENDHDMIDALRVSIDECKNEKGEKIQTQQDAIDYLVSKMRIIKKYSETDKNIKYQQKRLHLQNLLETGFLPHMENGIFYKGAYLCYAIHRMLNCYLGRTQKDDRDAYINKRIDMPGNLMDELFRQLYKKMLNECNKFFKRRNTNDSDPINIINQIKPNIIEQGLQKSLSTGLWIRHKGVAQMLNRLTYIQTISFLRRVDAPSGDQSTSKLTGPRHLHQTTVRWMCPVSTPEHASVGLTKHLSLLGNITIFKYSQYMLLREFLAEKIVDVRDIPSSKLKNMTKLFLNGEWLGGVRKPHELYNEVKTNKLNGTFDPTISVVRNVMENELRIYCDGGRGYAPAIIVKNNKCQLTRDLVNSIYFNKSERKDKLQYSSYEEFVESNPQVIENLDCEEQIYSMIAENMQQVENMRVIMEDSIGKVADVHTNNVINRYNEMTYLRYSHCEIHPALLLGEIPTCVPFCNSNHGPRNIFNYAQSKQAMGIYISNYRDRLDISYILYNPQRPIVYSRTSKYMYADDLPAGENAVVAIAFYTGYNMEDSLIFNKSSLERGKFASEYVRKFMPQIQKNHTTAQDDVFMKPDPSKVVGMRNNSYNKLNDKGYVPEETGVVSGDILIGKVSPIHHYQNQNAGAGKNTKMYKDNSEVYKANSPGVVDKVYTGIHTNEGYEMIKMRIRSQRLPNIGDKFACYTPDHDVLTQNGWIPISELTQADKVACISNDILEYHNPTEIQNYDCNNDDMYVVENEDISLKVTMNHRMYVSLNGANRFSVEEARKIVGRRYSCKKNVMYRRQSGVIKTIRIMDKKVGTYGLSILLGNIFGSDAKIESDKLYLGNASDVDQGITLMNGIRELGLICCENMVIKSEDSDLNTLIVNYVNSLNGNLPSWLLKLSLFEANAFFQMLHKDKKHTKHNSDLLQIMYFCYGKVVNILADGCISNGSKYTKRGAYDRIEKYTGKVYCCTVPTKRGIIYVRRNGKGVWCGNSQHGNKGTIGIILKASDMPFTKDGIIPDIILNTHAMPGRMTMGQIIECIVGKLAAISGTTADGTPFNDFDINEVREKLEKFGYNGDGNEYLYNGMTGQKFKSMIFIGPTYYKRLKHLVEDKIHCLDYETEVLTLTGWKNGYKLTFEDRIATLNPATNMLEYANPTNIMHYPNYAGDMYFLENQNLDIAVTGNHRQYISLPNEDMTDFDKYSLVNASDVVGRCAKYKKDCLISFPDYNFELPYINDDVQAKPVTCMKEWLKFLGVWIVNGYLSAGTVLISQASIYRPDAFYSVITKLGYSYTIGQGKIKIVDYQLYTYLSSISNTKLPEWVWSLSSQQAQIMLKAMILDYCTQTNATYQYYTSSKDLTDDIMRLTLYSGWVCDVFFHTRKGNEAYVNKRKIIAKNDVYRLVITKNCNEPLVNCSCDCIYNTNVNIQKEVIINKKCPVFCVEVPNQIFYVRRNGKGVWTGNSRARGPRTTLTRHPPEGRSKDGGFRLGEMERDTLIAYGMSKFIKEKLLDTSDVYRTNVCDDCGLFAQRLFVRNSKKRLGENDTFYCPPCKNYNRISPIRIPYAFKLLIQELMSMNILPRLRTG